jgi:hypothetical protein
MTDLFAPAMGEIPVVDVVSDNRGGLDGALGMTGGAVVTGIAGASETIARGGLDVADKGTGVPDVHVHRQVKPLPKTNAARQ